MTHPSEEAIWLHLRTAHGFSDWTNHELAAHYPSFVHESGAVDVVGLHDRDHSEQQPDLNHDHSSEGGEATD